MSACHDDGEVVGKQQRRSAFSPGLIVTELVINALKHAFPYGHAGLIEVAYRAGRAGWALLVSDDGIGMNRLVPVTSGLGTGIVKALSQQLHATVSYSDAGPGTVATISALPLAARLAPVAVTA